MAEIKRRIEVVVGDRYVLRLWPRTAAEVRREINAEQLRMVLAGIDFWRAHEEPSAARTGCSPAARVGPPRARCSTA